MTVKTPHQICVETLIASGFQGAGSHFDKGDCHVWIMDDKIRLSFNVAGIDKEYIGPPLPSAEKLKSFLKENTY